MTAEPRDVEAIRADLARLGELDEAFRARVEMARQVGVRLRGGLSGSADSSERNSITPRLVADVEPLLGRLAAADRDNAELRGEVERLRRQVIDHAWTANDIDQSLRDRLSVVTKYRHERNEARSQLAAAQAQLAEARGALAAANSAKADWLSKAVDRAARARLAEARLEAVRALHRNSGQTGTTAMPACDECEHPWLPAVGAVPAGCPTIRAAAALSAAPQPPVDIEGDRGEVLTSRPEMLGAAAPQPEPEERS